MKVLIIAGGQGTRLWPLSRLKEPKQLQPLINGRSLLQETVKRAERLVNISEIFLVVANEFQVAAVQKQIPNLPAKNILREPEGKNTAAAITYGAATLNKQFGDDETVIIFSADHAIGNPDLLITALKEANIFLSASPETLITIGITPTYPETGYGYIAQGDEIKKGIYKITAFKEKPSEKMAEQYVANGRHHWNAGIFAWKTKSILENLTNYSPNHLAIIEAVKNEGDLAAAYGQTSNISIDYAVLEKAKNLAVITLDLDWRDIGHWKSLKAHLQKNDNENVIEGKHICLDTKNTLVVNKSDRLIATIGVDNLIIVDTDDALLICHDKDAQKVREIAEKAQKLK